MNRILLIQQNPVLVILKLFLSSPFSEDTPHLSAKFNLIKILRPSFIPEGQFKRKLQSGH